MNWLEDIPHFPSFSPIDEEVEILLRKTWSGPKGELIKADPAYHALRHGFISVGFPFQVPDEALRVFLNKISFGGAISFFSISNQDPWSFRISPDIEIFLDVYYYISFTENICIFDGSNEAVFSYYTDFTYFNVRNELAIQLIGKIEGTNIDT